MKKSPKSLKDAALSNSDMVALRGGDGDEFPIPPKDGSPAARGTGGTGDADRSGGNGNAYGHSDGKGNNG